MCANINEVLAVKCSIQVEFMHNGNFTENEWITHRMKMGGKFEFNTISSKRLRDDGEIDDDDTLQAREEKKMYIAIIPMENTFNFRTKS